jgi:apolipoprotein N-acyltransferase
VFRRPWKSLAYWLIPLKGMVVAVDIVGVVVEDVLTLFISAADAAFSIGIIPA